MSFAVKTSITQCADFSTFLAQWNVGKGDLIITNEYVIAPHMGGKPVPCDTLFQEKYGSGEPSDEMVDAMLAAAAGKEYNRIIAIGGGTVIDISKLFVFGDGLRCEEIFEKGATLPRRRQLVILPTTCGTGSEVTNISIIEFKTKHTKLGLATPSLIADEAVLVPTLLATLPYNVFAASSIDALIHATESYVSPKADYLTRAMAKGAMDLIIHGYQKMVAAGKEKTLPDNLGEFHAASTMAGIAFGNAGVGAVHALAYPIGAIYHVPHGDANYMVFQAVFAAYSALGANLSQVEAALGDSLGCKAGEVWKELFALIDKVLVRKPLRELGVGDKECLEMAESVILNQQRLLVNNPTELSQADVADIYRKCV